VEKAPDAFRTISEVAEEINVPQHVLRFWESRFTQIRPLKRGGGRRYYRPDDVNLLRGVRHLLYGEGYTIRGVQRILREEGLGFVQEVWKGGAPPPPPDRQDDEHIADEQKFAEPAEKEEPSFFGLAPLRATPSDDPAGRREPTLMPTPASAPPQDRLSAGDRTKLQSALDELVTCRQLIDAALADVAIVDSAGEA
jgi:DNA-binding transcriptional MerR regulator